MNPNIPKAQLDEERKKRRAGSHPKTDPKTTHHEDMLYGFAAMLKPAFEAWCRRRGFPLPSEHREAMNDASYRRAKRFLDQQETAE